MSFKELPIMPDKSKGVMLFYPYVSNKSAKNIKKKLAGRWLGQGPMVDIFEKEFKKRFAKNYSVVATGSGTDSLHLAYILAGLKSGDEVIAPVFTCTATNIPLLYMGIKIKFADVDINTMNISIESVKKLISKKTKAIVVVHYGGLPCDMEELSKISKKYRIPIVEDAAHALGAKYNKKNDPAYHLFLISIKSNSKLIKNTIALEIFKSINLLILELLKSWITFQESG
jgi:dTDP-4-amino-4,6-dideoxygalactose transaminase